MKQICIALILIISLSGCVTNLFNDKNNPALESTDKPGGIWIYKLPKPPETW